mmetsp:Transcript_14489/g.28041  ORF Transcript_14489/g.28041 Transcript_14489/m.28041 type:complete len:314 (+) Transcript_14489:46-987(+)
MALAATHIARRSGSDFAQTLRFLKSRSKTALTRSTSSFGVLAHRPLGAFPSQGATRTMSGLVQAGPEATFQPSSVDDVSFDGRLVLFNNRVCPFGQRAWWALLEKDVKDFDYQHIDLRDTKPAFYMESVNPSGTVPCLYDDGNAVFESLICAEFVEDKFPGQGTTLLPSDAFERAAVRMVIGYWDKAIPLLYRLLRNPDESKDEEIVKDLKSALAKVNSAFEKQSEGPYFLGDRFSLADLAIAPFIDRLSVVLPHYRSFDPFPADCAEVSRIVRMYEEVKTRPAFQTTAQDPEYYIHAYSSYGEPKREIKASL